MCEIDKQNCRASAVDRSTYDKMKYSNFHLLIGILLVFMFYQSANDNLSYLRWCSLHSVVKLFVGWARLGKTSKESGNEIENYSYKSASNKRKNIPTNFLSCIV